MESAVKMLEIEESPLKDGATNHSNEKVHANGEMNGSCDESMDTNSSVDDSSQQRADIIDSANSKDSSDFNATTNSSKVPKSEVPSDEQMCVDNEDNAPDEEDERLANGTDDDAMSIGSGASESEQNEPRTAEELASENERVDSRNVEESASENERVDSRNVDELASENDRVDSRNINDSASESELVESKNIEESDNTMDNVDDQSNVHELSEDDSDVQETNIKEHSDDESASRDKEVIDSTKESMNDSADVTVIDDNSEHKSNGDLCTSPEIEEVCDLTKEKDDKNEVINLDTPKKKKKPMEVITPPRRSTRNLNKQKSYREDEEDADDPKVPGDQDDDDDDDDIEEITPEDPLADSSVNENKKVRTHHAPSHNVSASNSGTIVVKDTKKLVEIAANSKPMPTIGKKEPTLVIIDTNSILSGRGPVPINQKSSQLATSYQHVLPMALPAQGIYPANMRATITPIPLQPKPAPAPILPSLTDDMYVVEAPSFIVPYVYEKPPLKPLKEFVGEVGKAAENDEKEKLAKRKADKERIEKEKAEKKKAEKEKKRKEKAERDKNGDEDSENDSDDDKDEDYDEDKDGDDDDEDKDSDSETNKSAEVENVKTVDNDSVIDVEKELANNNKPKSNSYFDNPLGKFFFNIGYGLVQEFVQTDLLKQQKRKRDRESHMHAINSLMKNLEFSRENNKPFHMELKKCDFCSFRTESALALAHHLETPHMRNYIYRCNFCTLEARGPHDILFHMEAEHNTRGRLERAPAFHQCPNCPFEDNQKGKLSRHMLACAKKFKPDRNLEPPTDWEPPAKIPRLQRGKQVGLVQASASYQAAMAQAKNLPMMQQARLQSPVLNRPRGRPSMMGGKIQVRPGMVYQPARVGGGQVLVPTAYQYAGNQIYQVVGGRGLEVDALRATTATVVPPQPLPTSQTGNYLIQAQTQAQNSVVSKSQNKAAHQPSISITPLPRQSSSQASSSSSAAPTALKPGEPNSSKATFVICEICDGYIKDLEQLRNHMQWIHKVKIHPKMIYNRPPLNCQKCQFRFFTDQGLERHLLGSHGLVTSSMQEAANKGKDAGRCPVCGRVYQWKLLNHVARDHKITLKPAHLSYKCTVCTATFGMYKQFENHVYSAHSVVAKRVMDKKNGGSSNNSSPSTSRQANDTLLKPLKINDEITIIPQPSKPRPSSTSTRTS